MPLCQSLLPPTGTAQPPTPAAAKIPAAEAAAVAAAARNPPPSSSSAGDEERRDEVAADVETERVRGSMREEARSAVLRALAALLVGCGDETRQQIAASAAATETGAETAAAVKVAPPTAGEETQQPATLGLAAGQAEETARLTENATAAAAGGASEGEEPEVARARPASEDDGGCGGSLPLTLTTATPVTVQPEPRGLVPICLRLLHGCGGAAEPNPAASCGTFSRKQGSTASAAVVPGDGETAPNGSNHRVAPGTGRVGSAPSLPGGAVPAGRKVELLKVIGNACFRCRRSQDLVREEGGLPLVLNHCTVDEANPLLR